MKKFFTYLFWIVIVIVVLRACFSSKTPAKETATSKEGVEIEGHDPQAFSNALELYENTDVDPISNEEADQLLEELSIRISSGFYPEMSDCIGIMHELKGVKDFSDIIDRVDSLAELTAGSIGTPIIDYAEAASRFSQANTYYKQGSYDNASEAYRELLEEYPGHPDARNNLGLTEMHQGNNLTAYLHFRTLAEMIPEYYGASVNATVALERMGLSDKAYEAAKDLVKNSEKLPMAYYNLGWFENTHGLFEDADKNYATAISIYPNYEKAAQAKAMNAVENGKGLGKNELKAFNSNQEPDWSGKNQQIAEIKNDTDVMAGETAVAFAQKGEKYLVAQEKGDWVAIYALGEDKKELGWILKSDMEGYESSNHLFSWWWWWLVIIIILSYINMSRATKNHKDASLGWVFLSWVFIIIFGIIYAIWLGSVAWLGWTFAALATLNYLILWKTSSY